MNQQSAHRGLRGVYLRTRQLHCAFSVTAATQRGVASRWNPFNTRPRVDDLRPMVLQALAQWPSEWLQQLWRTASIIFSMAAAEERCTGAGSASDVSLHAFAGTMTLGRNGGVSSYHMRSCLRSCLMRSLKMKV